MAGKGPAPKDPERRAGKQKDPHPTVKLDSGGPVGPPALDDRFADNDDLVRWWKTWTESPQAKQFMSTDWLFLYETLPLVAAFWAGELKHAPEIRLRIAKFGATIEDRLRLRMMIDMPLGPVATEPAAAADEVMVHYGALRAV